MKPLPDNRIDLKYKREFSPVDSKKLLLGFEPRDMDDKWIIFYKQNWVYFARSWTQNYIFGLELEEVSDGAQRVVASWVNGNNEEYRRSGKEKDFELLNGILEHVLGIESRA